MAVARLTAGRIGGRLVEDRHGLSTHLNELLTDLLAKLSEFGIGPLEIAGSGDDAHAVADLLRGVTGGVRGRLLHKSRQCVSGAQDQDACLFAREPLSGAAVGNLDDIEDRPQRFHEIWIEWRLTGHGKHSMPPSFG